MSVPEFGAVGSGAADVPVFRLDSVGSTNSEALLRARSARQGDCWIVAGRQTGGRGRHGRAWASPPGGLYASRLIVTGLELGELVGLTLVAGLAAHDAAAKLTDAGEQIRLKWPNDLLAGTAKLAGILIETERLDEDRIAVAVGIGINVATRAAADNGAASIEALAGPDDPARVFDALAPAFAARRAEWDQGRGFDRTRRAWERRALPEGTPMRVRLPSGDVRGEAAGLDASGGLKLRLASGEVQILRAGEVILMTEPVEAKLSA